MFACMSMCTCMRVFMCIFVFRFMYVCMCMCMCMCCACCLRAVCVLCATGDVQNNSLVCPNVMLNITINAHHRITNKRRYWAKATSIEYFHAFPLFRAIQTRCTVSWLCFLWNIFLVPFLFSFFFRSSFLGLLRIETSFALLRIDTSFALLHIHT